MNTTTRKHDDSLQNEILWGKAASWISFSLILIVWVACFALPFIALNGLTAQWGDQPTLISLINKEDIYSLDSIKSTYYEIALITCFVGSGISIILLLMRRHFISGIVLAVTNLKLIYCCIRSLINFTNHFDYRFALRDILGSGVWVSSASLTLASILLLICGWQLYARHKAEQKKREALEDGEPSLKMAMIGNWAKKQLYRAKDIGNNAIRFYKANNGKQTLAFLCVPTLLFVILPALAGNTSTILTALLVVALVGCMFGCLANLVILGFKKLLWLWIVMCVMMALMNGLTVFVVTSIILALSFALMYAANKKWFSDTIFSKRAVILSMGTCIILSVLCLSLASVNVRLNVAPAAFIILAIIVISAISAYIIEKMLLHEKKKNTQ